MDQTEGFREAVKAAAARSGFSDVKLAELAASLILKRPRHHSTFSKSANQILASIRALHGVIVQNRKAYLDRHRTTERERDEIEHEVSLLVKTCREKIDALKPQTVATGGKGAVGKIALWGGESGGVANTNVVAHQHGVILILSEQLHAVTAMFDKMRAARFQEVVSASQGGARSTETFDMARLLQDGQLEGATSSASNKLMLDDETRALQVELTSLLEDTRTAEQKVLEMSALSHLMSTQVLQQAQQIEMLYKQAIEATQNLEGGNKEIVKTISNNSDSRTFLILFMVVASLALLFLDWYAS